MNYLILNDLKNKLVEPYEAPPLFTRSPLGVFFRNLVSLGRYTLETVQEDQNTINELEYISTLLENRALTILATGNQIEKDLVQLQQKFDQKKFNQLHAEYKSLFATCNAEVPNRYFWSSLDRVTQLFSFLTLGLSTLYQNYFQKKRISNLRNKEIQPLKKIINENFKAKLEGLQKQFDLLLIKASNQTLMHEIREIDIQKSQDDTEAILSKISRYKSLQSQENDIRDLVNSQKQSNRDFTRQVNALQVEIDIVQRFIDTRNPLQQELVAVEQTESKVQDLLQLQADTGFLPPRYVRREEDQGVAGAPGINEEQDKQNGVVLTAENRRYADAVNGKKTAPEVVESCFLDAVKKLIDLGFISISSFDITKQRDQKRSLYEYTALHLIKGAILFLEGPYNPDCHGPSLALNSDNVPMVSSIPKRTLTKTVDPKTHQEVLTKKIIATRIDAFTPTVLTEDSPGIDPLSLKWILAQLTDFEKRVLTAMIMDYDKKNPYLHDYLRTGPEDRIRLIKLAKTFISELALVFEEKFDTILINNWKTNRKLISKYKGSPSKNNNDIVQEYKE